ncbi:MAG: GNAT family N-acetyltransferase [Actinobacteria bacterium]|nr:GNAT family N-acetyltransferase [Actinomycetota bacterium]
MNASASEFQAEPDERAATDLTAAWATAQRAIDASRVHVREVHDIDEMHQIQRLYERIWRTGPTGTPVTADMLRAMAKAESYVVGAFEDDVLVGACFGFFGPPARRTLHSHIAGVDQSMHGRHVGLALKLHQRAWAMQHGAEAITWTFDPLIRRNAYFNIGKLAASAVEYLPSFYGPMDDAINRADDTDRMLIRWHLGSPAVIAACEASAPSPAAKTRPELGSTAHAEAQRILEPSQDGAPIRHEPRSSTVLVGIPADIEAMRLSDPALAAKWRIALRETLGTLMSGGARVSRFSRDGWYVVEREKTP